MAGVRAAVRTVLFVGLTLLLLPPYLAGFAVGPKARRPVAAAWYRAVRGLCGIRVRRRGMASSERPTLFVANHVSYLDVIVLGALLDATFVSKSEVAGWPVFGWLARLSGTVFISRKRSAAARQRDQLAERLRRGENLVFFPEGTSSDGTRVLPFGSSLFAVAEGAAVVQPVSISYVVEDVRRPLYAWYGDMAFLPHLLGVFAGAGVRVDVQLHPLVPASRFGDRKALARHCESEVARGVEAAPTATACGLAGLIPDAGEMTVFSIG